MVAPCALSYASDSGTARIYQLGGGQSEGAKQPSGGGCGSSSVASFLVWGGGKTPKCTDRQKSCTQKHIFRSQNTSVYMLFPFITCGMAL